MALDKLVDSAQLDSDLASVANAIRTKGGTSASLAFPQGFVDAVGAISGGDSRVLHHETFIPTAVYDRFNPLIMQLTPSENFCIAVVSDGKLEPDETYYQALLWGQAKVSHDGQTADGIVHAILRPNGTIGTDATQCVFDPSTGILSIGGNYGKYLPGVKYHVFQFDLEVSAQ